MINTPNQNHLTLRQRIGSKSRETYGKNTKIRLKTSMLSSSLCD